MSRLIFPKGLQKKWIEKVISRSGQNIDSLALLSGVSSRTTRDWKRGKYSIPEDVANTIVAKYSINLPKSVKIVDNYWYVSKGARIGGLKRFEKYGLLGNIKTRIKGGKISQLRRKQNPEKYRLLGCNVRKDFLPLRESRSFAEMTGIILGDGGITTYQLRVTLDKKTDLEYIPYVCNLSKTVFGESFNPHNRNFDGAVDLTLSGIGLIENLSRFGLYKGDKIRRQIDFPQWIWKKRIYQQLCVRGLIDTDGCVFPHFHSSGGKKYRNLRVHFSSRSVPLVKSVSKVLVNENIKHFVDVKRGAINIYDLKHIIKYDKYIGFSNPKHSKKFNYHLMYNRRLN